MTSEPMPEKDNKATIQPAAKPASWPNYEGDKAKQEIAAMQMLCDGLPRRRIRQRTQLSYPELHRLAELVAEDATDPPRPRNVSRDRHPARVRIARKPTTPHQPSSSPEQLELVPDTPPHRDPQPRAPEQLPLLTL